MALIPLPWVLFIIKGNSEMEFERFKEICRNHGYQLKIVEMCNLWEFIHNNNIFNDETITGVILGYSYFKANNLKGE